MRKVVLTMTEQQKYEVIKKLVETNGNKNRAAIELGCSQRHVNRLVKGYKEKGKAFFLHGNRGRRPVNTISDEVKDEILTLYDNKYYGANFTHYAEMLAESEGIAVSKSFLRGLFLEGGIPSPMATRKTRRRLRQELERAKEKATSKRKRDYLQGQIVGLEESHPRRPRCANFGEMIQMDASVCTWFADVKVYLHLAVDDCTGCIVGAFFAPEETLVGYYNVLHQILVTYGIPYSFYTDRRTVFEYRRKESALLEKDTFTQFGYACKQLGIEIKTTSIPEAKGRVERMFRTLKSRLPILLRLAGVTTIEQANEFLYSYIKEFNGRFALPINHSKSVFETQPDTEKINLILAVITKRKIDGGHSIRFKNKYFLPLRESGAPVYFYKGTTCLVIEAFDGNLYAVVNDTVFALEEIPVHEEVSRNFDLPTQVPIPRKRYIPPMNHPWRTKEFFRHVGEQPHRRFPDGVTYEDLWYTTAVYT